MSSYVFVDARVQNWPQLLAGLAADIEVVVLDPIRDGIVQIAAALEGVTDLNAIHVISHGSAGTLYLGRTVLTSENLSSYRSELGTIGATLSDSGDILLYGCEVASGITGQTFIENLALYTNADVAASTDTTGSAALGGDWVLEASTGAIKADISFTVESQELYLNTLADFVPDNTSTTFSVTVGGSVTGNVDVVGDQDWYRVSLVAGHPYQFDLQGAPTGQGTIGDAFLRLFDATGALVTINDDSGEGLNSLILYTANQSGTYFLSAGGYGSNVGTFLLSVLEHVDLVGTPGDDTLTGGTGNDTLDGGAGADLLVGGEGRDSLIGGTGNDTFYGDASNDTLIGGDGDDTLNGGTGLDSVSYTGASTAVSVSLAITTAQNTGGAGSDTLTAIEHLEGSNHNDTLTGGTAANLLSGGLGNDDLNGNAGNDTLNGGDGDDTLTGGTGDDNLVGGTGLDWAYYNGAGSAVTVNLATRGAQNTGGAGIDTLATLEHLLGSNFDDTLTGNSAANQLDGGAGNDTLDGGSGNDTMAGGLGNDTYVVNAAGDQVTEASGAGTDTVRSSTNHTLAANVEHLTLTGAGNTTANGNTLANQLTGNSGHNTLNGGSGNDTMAGGLGNDTYVVNAAGDQVTEASGAGTDTVRASTSHTLLLNVEHLILTGAGNSSGTGNDLDNKLTGNSGNNTLNGGGGADTLTGGAGADTMAGGLGDDTYSVNAASDVVTEAAAAGTDLVRASTHHMLAANVEHLILTGAGNSGGMGNTLNNQITGNRGHNTLSGNDGADTLSGGTGNDTLSGGTGIDTFDYNALTDAGDTITGFTAGAGGDKIDIDTLMTALGYGGADPIAAGYVQLLQAGAHTQVNIDSNGGGDSFATTLTTLQNVTATNVTLADNFIV
jgi:Ca2+-binding RTX toxin-like protein